MILQALHEIEIETHSGAADKEKFIDGWVAACEEAHAQTFRGVNALNPYHLREFAKNLKKWYRRELRRPRDRSLLAYKIKAYEINFAPPDNWGIIVARINILSGTYQTSEIFRAL